MMRFFYRINANKMYLVVSALFVLSSTTGWSQNTPKPIEKKAGELEDVVIKGEGTQGMSTSKPPIDVKVNPYETIVDSLKPDESLLLAESPMTFTWRRSHPDLLRSRRVIQPWRASFNEQSDLRFQPFRKLSEILRRSISLREAKKYQWSLTIADEEGKVFQRFEGKGEPPEELSWTGQNDQGEWIKAGHAYSAVYLFVDPSGAPHTGVGHPLQFKGIVHQEESGLFISLDSSILFGPAKESDAIVSPGGENILRSTSDVIKRRYFGFPVRVRAYAKNTSAADAQAKMVKEYLLSELMISPQNIAVEGYSSSFSEQRVDVLMLNR
ncbi:MAG: hypothetical protein HY399_02415 [Elusimicrobia bacterium]|nr:hypothetical protein [Elusimicrobiota bacterium]